LLHDVINIPDIIKVKHFVFVPPLAAKKIALYKNICTLAVLPPLPVVAIALNTNIHNTF
jgi:hypothetical protein